MAWLLTDENMATAIVIAGFCLFSFVMFGIDRVRGATGPTG
jgi:hypothetical protein